MSTHRKRGFQTVFINDIYHVEEQLKDYDEHLYLMFNPSTGEHLVMDGLLDLAIMKIPQIGFEILDRRVVNHIKRIHTLNGFKATEELKKSEERRERESRRVKEDISYNFAKDTKKAVRQLAYYGG